MKLKTSKSAKKRFRVSSTGKMQHRKANMNHFNAKDSGHERRRKRSQKLLPKSDTKNIKALMPYLAS